MEVRAMKRDISFRGKRIDTGEWVYGCYCYNPLTQKGYIYSFDCERSYVYEVDPSSVGQCTGIKDKNGREIYEGDVLQQGNKRFKVKWGMGEPSFFALSDEKWGNCYSVQGLANNGAVVIGNIHDNPELLQEVSP
jgi:uncharacterized phage protein (TIGR01671 family)